jgi:ankyrin repeat protein
VLTELSGCGDAEVEAEAKQAMSMPGWTSEMWEAINGRKVDKVTQLLTINKDLAKLVDKSGATPLHKVATPPITETAYLCAKALLESRAGVNAQDLVGRTPLCLAVGAMQPIGVKLVKQLLRAGGDLNSMTNDGKTVIQLAHESGYRPMTDFLRQYVLQQGIDIKE